MKAIAFAAFFLATFAARSCDAQQSRAQVSASVTIVEAIGVTTGATAVTRASGGTLDVTTPLSIRGNAPRVVHVVDDAERARPIAAQLRPACPPAEGTAEPCAIRSRIPAATEGDRLLTYLVATVN